jgi:hypothetical protein
MGIIPRPTSVSARDRTPFLNLRGNGAALRQVEQLNSSSVSAVNDH